MKEGKRDCIESNFCATIRSSISLEMKAITTILFLTFLILTGVLIIGNMSYTGDFFFLMPLEGKTLALPFLGFACLGMCIGILFVFSLRYMFMGSAKDIDDASLEQ